MVYANELIDKKELCHRLKWGKTKVEKLMRERKIPFIKDGPTRRASVRYDWDDVIKALKKLTRKKGAL